MIELESISKSFGSSDVLKNITLTFEDFSTTVIIGPSGCGKSTMIRLINGLIKPDTGNIYLHSSRITTENIYDIRHQIGYVIQEGGLFPHLTARENISILADYLKRDSTKTEERIEYLCELTKFPGDLINRYPIQLSGGQRQRVSLMRALMMDPQTLLLDEPLGSLDPITRADLQKDLKTIFEQLKKTVVLVTHDIGEAQYFGRKLILMKNGEIVQEGSFDELVNFPSSGFVSEFINAQRIVADW